MPVCLHVSSLCRIGTGTVNGLLILAGYHWEPFMAYLSISTNTYYNVSKNTHPHYWLNFLCTFTGMSAHYSCKIALGSSVSLSAETVGIVVPLISIVIDQIVTLRAVVTSTFSIARLLRAL